MTGESQFTNMTTGIKSFEKLEMKCCFCFCYMPPVYAWPEDHATHVFYINIMATQAIGVTQPLGGEDNKAAA